MAFNVREKCRFHTRIFNNKKNPTVGGGFVGGGKTPPTLSPRSVASLPRVGLLKTPGYAMQ